MQTALNCFVDKKNAVPIQILFEKEVDSWLKKQTPSVQQWAKANAFEEKKILLLASAKGELAEVIFIIHDEADWLSIGDLPLQLPQSCYAFRKLSEKLLTYAHLAWGMAAYKYTRYKKSKRAAAQLAWSKEVNQKEIINTLEAIYLIRDLINTPADHMMPQDLADCTQQLAKKFKAKFKQAVGKDLLKENFPCIYHVGRASQHEPRLLELRWGNRQHPQVTLVGKGVCFDTGGLNLKDDKGMLIMKKDMGGAAHVLGLAQLIMSQNLPIQLRVLIPTVENAISGAAYHPGDILTSRTGKTIEINNTDAEGRLILCDALAAAAEKNPTIIIDFATLTGAARISVGTDLAAFFTNDKSIAKAIFTLGEHLNDPCWQMPLFKPYLKSLDSTMADLKNCASDSYGAAIIAALFLQEFISNAQAWVHFDIMAWNLRAKPGKPEGGEAMAIRTVYAMLKERLC